MKRLGLLLIGLTMVILLKGQTIKVQGGVSISELDYLIKGNFPSVSIYDEKLISYSLFAGLDYLDKQYFNLSSNIGMIRKGGKDEFLITDEYGQSTGLTSIEKPTLDYLSMNTLFELKYRIKDAVAPFISIGPRFDYLVKSNEHFEDLKDLDELKSISLGLLLGGGVKYDIQNLQFGLRADYYLNFVKVADWNTEFTSRIVNVSTLAINLMIGYRLQ